jgi:DNA repair and recombination protein RAD52
MFTAQMNNALSAPLDRAVVKERTQSGRTFSYIEGWYAIAEANRIFGFDGWHRETVDIRCVNERPRKIGRDGRDGWAVSYIVRVRIIVGDVIRDGMGSGHGIDADCGLAHESAIKEAETDAMKRALMTFGNPFGLALYDKEQRQVVDAPPEKLQPSDVRAMIDEILRMQTTVSLRKWWKQTADFRASVGLVDGTEEYQLLYNTFVNHGKKLAAGENVNG